jgi:hypothetical protein
MAQEKIQNTISSNSNMICENKLWQSIPYFTVTKTRLKGLNWDEIKMKTILTLVFCGEFCLYSFMLKEGKHT